MTIDRFFSICIAITLLLMALPSLGGPAALSNQTERRDRSVDHVALSNQVQAINKLKALMKKYRGKPQEALFLERLTQLLDQRAAIEFRLSRGNQLSRYNQTLREEIRTVDRILSRFPNRRHDRSLSIRGKAYEELSQVKKAEKDYQTIVDRYIDSPFRAPALMSLAQFATDRSQHAQAAHYLQSVVDLKGSPYRVYAFHKLAWAKYNLSQFDQGIENLFEHIRLIRSQQKENQSKLSASDEAMIENALRDVALFSLDKHEKEKRSASDTMALFQSIEPGKYLGMMCQRYAKLLKAHQADAGLMDWMKTVVGSAPQLEETFDIVEMVFTLQFDRADYSLAATTAKHLETVYSSQIDELSARPHKSYIRSQKALISRAEKLRKLIIANKTHSKAKQLTPALASLYQTFHQIVDQADPRIPGARYNLAETLFNIGRFEDATQHYTWIVENWSRFKNVSISGGKTSIQVRRIASRYETLKEEKIVPQKIKPVALSQNVDTPIENGRLLEWLAWLDEVPYSKIESFHLEAARILYHQNRIENSLQKLEKLAARSKREAEPAARLILDTHLLSQDWEKMSEVSRNLLKKNKWGKNFKNELFEQAFTADLKQLETLFESEKYKETLKLSEVIESRYPNEKRLSTVMDFAAQSAEKTQDFDRMLKETKRLSKSFPHSKQTTRALTRRAEYYETQLEYFKASQDLFRLTSLKLDSSLKVNLFKKALYFSWLSGHLRASHFNSNLCQKVKSECDQYQGLLAVKATSWSGRKLAQVATKAPLNNRPIWALAALNKSEELRFPDRMLMVRLIAGRWQKLSSTIQIALLPYLHQSLSLAFVHNRKAIAQYVKIQANEKSISKRISRIREMEETAKRIMKWPWQEIRASVLGTLAGLYQDVSTELGALKPPKGLKDREGFAKMTQELALPFTQKSDQILDKALAIASASGSIQMFDQLSLTKTYRYTPVSLSLELLQWLEIEITEEVQTWRKAYLAQNLPLMSGLLSLYSEQDRLGDLTQRTLRALTLAAAGSVSVALNELMEMKDEPTSKALRAQIHLLLISRFVRTQAPQPLEDLVEDFAELSERIDEHLRSNKEAFLVLEAARISGASLSEANQTILKEASKGVSLRELAKN